MAMAAVRVCGRPDRSDQRTLSGYTRLGDGDWADGTYEHAAAQATRVDRGAGRDRRPEHTSAPHGAGAAAGRMARSGGGAALERRTADDSDPSQPDQHDA